MIRFGNSLSDSFLLQTKQSLADSLLEGMNMSHKLTTQDLMELLG